MSHQAKKGQTCNLDSCGHTTNCDGRRVEQPGPGTVVAQPPAATICVAETLGHLNQPGGEGRFGCLYG